MTLFPAKAPLPPEDLLARSDANGDDRVEGQLVEKYARRDRVEDMFPAPEEAAPVNGSQP